MRESVQRAEGVELHADVADVRPYLADSAVMAVPLRIGGGSRIKILESLACGLPVVSTRVGAEGLPLRSGEELVIVDSVSEMAAALVRALRDRGGMRRLAERGRQIVEGHFDWKALALKLEEAWHQCVAEDTRIRSEAT
jgi:glycosyltransferase involved in cell wall biosynthesis